MVKWPYSSKKPTLLITLVFIVRRACRTSEVQVLCGHPLPVNPIATPNPDYREVAGRGRDSESGALRTDT
ncbi:hypothetical protein HK147_03210 [Streptococcus agalactiae]|nr:hypothetical protein [Streptococcus agalactiae]